MAIVDENGKESALDFAKACEKTEHPDHFSASTLYDIAYDEIDVVDGYLKAVVPEAEKYNIKLALHPDDPPMAKLGDVERIMISAENIKKAIYDISEGELYCIGIEVCYDYKKTYENFWLKKMENSFFIYYFDGKKGFEPFLNLSVPLLCGDQTTCNRYRITYFSLVLYFYLA